MRAWGFVGLVLAVLLSGCGAEPPPPGPPPLTPLGALTLTGDPRAADPCALLDRTQFARSAVPQDVRGDTIGSCRALGRAADDRLQAVEAVFDSAAATTYPSAEPPEPAGTATVLRPAPADDVCRRIVALSDGTLVVFSGRGQAGAVWAADCQAAEQGMRAGLRQLAARGITYSPTWNAAPLATVDACAALGDPAALLGLVEPPRYPGFAGWRCLVGLPVPGGTAAWLDFVVTDALSPGVRLDVVAPYGGQFSPGCQVSLDRGPSGPDPSQRQVARLTLEIPGPVGATCDRLRTLSAEVLGRLG